VVADHSVAHDYQTRLVCIVTAHARSIHRCLFQVDITAASIALHGFRCLETCCVEASAIEDTARDEANLHRNSINVCRIVSECNYFAERTARGS
jgi:hypothetical protein